MDPVFQACNMPESRAEDHETSSESSYKDMNEVAEPGSSAHHTPSPISESAVAELDPLDNAVQLSDERVATEPQSRESSVGEARPVIELSGIKKPHKEHTSVVDDARSGHASLSTPVQDFLQPVDWIRESFYRSTMDNSILIVAIFLSWGGLLLWIVSQMIPPGRLRRCFEIVEPLFPLGFYLYITSRIMLPERLLERHRFGEPQLQQGMQRVRWKCVSNNPCALSEL